MLSTTGTLDESNWSTASTRARCYLPGACACDRSQFSTDIDAIGSPAESSVPFSRLWNTTFWHCG